MKIRMLKAGMQATIQDTGRIGFRRLGVPVSGCMDPVSAAVAHWLCGNDSAAVLIEQTLHGQEWKIERGGVIAVCGGSANLFCGEQHLPLGRRIKVEQGSILRFKPDSKGCYTYLAMEGGVKAGLQLGSASTYLPAGLGGREGRAINTGDVLECSEDALSPDLAQSSARNTDQPFSFEKWGIDLASILFSDEPIRFMRGPEFEWFEESDRNLFLHEEFRISVQSNRMGYQLDGPLLKGNAREELLSTAVTPGTIQVTHEGSAVVLMADAQTIGGYPRIGQVAAVDLPRLAQMRPGERVRFREIPWEEAEKRYFEREKWMRELRESIRLRIKH